MCADPQLPPFSRRYQLRYPLREWGLTREACGRIILDAGLPLPPKSACFFCPAMRPVEIAQLKQEEPDLYQLALEMERRYRRGRHFRGDGVFTVRARHRATGEHLEQVYTAGSPADARQQFRQQLRDQQRPYQWQLAVSQSVVGLGRNRSWLLDDEALAAD